MWSRLAAVPASSSEPSTGGPGVLDGQRIGNSARLTWLLRVLRTASPTYRSTIDDDQSSKRFAGLANSCEACEVRGASISDLTMRTTTWTNSDNGSRSGMPGLDLADHDGCHADSDRQPLPVAMTKSSACGCCTSSTSLSRGQSLAHRSNRASHRSCPGRASAESPSGCGQGRASPCA